MNQQTAREGFVRPVVSNETADNNRVNGKVIEHEPVVAAPAPAPEPDPEPYKETWPVKVKLMNKSIRGPRGDQVNEISFREPTGGDINRYGNPCVVDQEGNVIILDRKMITMMAALSGILQPFLEAMDPRDYNSCAYRLRGFFIPNPEAW